jgi:multidrug transporter EmrE-like cation transporter
VGVMLNVTAQILIKAGTNSIGYFEFSRSNLLPVGIRLATEPHIVGAIACYALSVVIWILALSRVQVSIAYPLLSMGYVVNAAAAWWFFNESINPAKIAGIGIIILGVIFISRS